MNNPWEHIARMSQEDQRRMQDRRLSDFVRNYLYPFSPHYRRLFDREKIPPRAIRTAADLQKIPFTSKKDFIDPGNPAKFRDFVLRPSQQRIRESWSTARQAALFARGLLKGPAALRQELTEEFRPVFMTFTSGTTSDPVAYLYAPRDMANLNLAGGRMLQVFGADPAEYIVSMFPYAPHLAFWQVVFGGLASGYFVMSTGGGKTVGTEGNIKAIARVRPAVIMGTPSYVYHLLRTARDMDCVFPSIRKVVLGAARVTPPFRQRLRELLSALGTAGQEILGTYGFTEARMAWGECPVKGDVSHGYHLYPDKEIFEIIDPESGKVLPEGADGEIVYTSIDSRGSSVLRFRTGDLARGGITTAPCPGCGRTVPRLSADITRLSDVRDVQITKVKGALVDLNRFAAVMAGFTDVEEWQLEIGKRDNDPYEVDELTLYLSARANADKSNLQDRIKSQMLVQMEVTPNRVVFLPLAELVQRLQLETAGKEKRIVDRRALFVDNKTHACPI